MPHFYKLKGTILVLFASIACAVFPPLARASAVTIAAPEAKAMPSLRKAISIKWEAVADAKSYVIEFRLEGGSFKELVTVDAPLAAYRHTGLEFNQQVIYRVKTVDAGGVRSDYSAEAEAMTHSADYTFRVMPLGDSNTHGHRKDNDNGSSVDVLVEKQVSYRKKLHELLLGQGINIDFVGSMSSGKDLLEDHNHAGFPGARDEDIAELLKYGSYTYYPGDYNIQGL